MKIEESEQQKLELMHEKILRLQVQERLFRAQLDANSKEGNVILEARNAFIKVLIEKYQIPDSKGIDISTGEIVEAEKN